MAECFIILFSEEAPHTIQLVLNLDAMLLLYIFFKDVFSGKVSHLNVCNRLYILKTIE